MITRVLSEQEFVWWIIVYRFTHKVKIYFLPTTRKYTKRRTIFHILSPQRCHYTKKKKRNTCIQQLHTFQWNDSLSSSFSRAITKKKWKSMRLVYKLIHILHPFWTHKHTRWKKKCFFFCSFVLVIHIKERRWFDRSAHFYKCIQRNRYKTCYAQFIHTELYRDFVS